MLPGVRLGGCRARMGAQQCGSRETFRARAKPLEIRQHCNAILGQDQVFACQEKGKSMPIRPPRVKIQQVEIKGYKSIGQAALDLQPVNILIGANGAGKSNFVSFFAMAASSLDGALNGYVNLHGGAGAFLHQGAKLTEHISWNLDVATEEGEGRVAQELSFKAPDSLAYTPLYSKNRHPSADWTIFAADICAVRASGGRVHAQKILNGVRDGIAVHHFHDTSIKGPLRGPADISATLRLDGAGSNLPAILHSYERLENAGKLVRSKS